MTILILLYILCIFGIAEGDDQNTLKIVETEPQQFQSVYCQIDSIPTRLFMPKECSAIKKVVIDGKELWSGDYCQLVLVHSPNRNPTFIRLFTEGTDGINDLLYQKVGKEWKNLASNTSMTILKEIQYTSHGVILDINYPPSNVKDVRANWCGIDVQLFVPNESHYAKEVCLVNEQIWKPGDDEKCVLIIVPLEHAFPITVHLLVRDKNGVVNSLFFVRDGLFKTSNGMEYYNKISVVRSENCKCQQWTCSV